MTQSDPGIQSAIRSIVVFDIDGVIRDVSGSYRLALADTVERFTEQAYRPSPRDIDALKTEGQWNNDWEASQELIYRYFEAQGKSRSQLNLDYSAIVAFFQSRYRGPDPDHWTGYICHEPLLTSLDYFEQLTQASLPWGFFSGATRGSAQFILCKRLGLQNPILIAMEDAPGKPDPTGLFATVAAIESQFQLDEPLPVIYAGDTVADMQTIRFAQAQQPQRSWIGVGILPPHVQHSEAYAQTYGSALRQSGAQVVLDQVTALDPARIASLFN